MRKACIPFPATHRASGFSLLEVLVAAALLTFAAGALLHNLAFTYRHYQIASDDWKTSLRLWNQASRWRAGLDPTPGETLPGDSGLPIQRVRFEMESAGRTITWEVLHARP